MIEVNTSRCRVDELALVQLASSPRQLRIHPQAELSVL
jgi:hypothetical protein